jgi:DNA-binding response OmpR family regulator
VKQIIIVDDNQAFAYFLGSTLKAHGFDVHHFSNCDESLAFITNGGHDPHYALLDLYIDNKVCDDFARTVRDALPHATIILMSGTSTKMDILNELLKQKVIDHFLKKPFDFNDLMNVMAV